MRLCYAMVWDAIFDIIEANTKKKKNLTETGNKNKTNTLAVKQCQKVKLEILPRGWHICAVNKESGGKKKKLTAKISQSCVLKSK